jgi:hypothetical protein
MNNKTNLAQPLLATNTQKTYNQTPMDPQSKTNNLPPTKRKLTRMPSLLQKGFNYQILDSSSEDDDQARSNFEDNVFT